MDTIYDVALCFNGALTECGFPEHSIEAYNGFVGGNLETIVTKLLPEQDRTEYNIERVKKAYRSLYSNSAKKNTKPYAGIPEMLYHLKERGFTLAVNTNKGQILTDELLDKLFTKELFSAIVGYDESRPAKPDPFGVDLICRQCGMQREDAMYIGDGMSDINTADNAGIPCVFVTWGQGTENDRNDSRIYCVVDSVTELEQVILQE